MPKTKERNEVEYLKSTIRKLKKEIKNLRKQLRHSDYSITDDEEEEVVPDVKHNLCPDCGKGTLLTALDLPTKLIYKCDLCGFTKSENK